MRTSQESPTRTVPDHKNPRISKTESTAHVSDLTSDKFCRFRPIVQNSVLPRYGSPAINCNCSLFGLRMPRTNNSLLGLRKSLFSYHNSQTTLISSSLSSIYKWTFWCCLLDIRQRKRQQMGQSREKLLALSGWMPGDLALHARLTLL